MDGYEGPRFAVVTHLLSVSAQPARPCARVRGTDDDFPRVASVTGLWTAANWFEREAFDLYGIVFEGHPDLRRILTDYGFVGHPFRKDFPTHRARRDALRRRAQAAWIYQPVSHRAARERHAVARCPYLKSQAEACQRLRAGAGS